MKLRIHVYDAEPYPINDFSTLEDAVEAEAINVASQADSRHLDEGTDAERDALRERVQRDALRALASTGRYTDPLGILWTLDADESENALDAMVERLNDFATRNTNTGRDY